MHLCARFRYTDPTLIGSELVGRMGVGGENGLEYVGNACDGLSCCKYAGRWSFAEDIRRLWGL